VLNFTTNWNSAIEVCKVVVGANCAPSEIDSTINLKELLQMVVGECLDVLPPKLE
jgi:hypothetical protein